MVLSVQNMLKPSHEMSQTVDIVKCYRRQRLKFLSAVANSTYNYFALSATTIKNCKRCWQQRFAIFAAVGNNAKK